MHETVRRTKGLVLIVALVIFSTLGCEDLKGSPPSCDSDVSAVKFFDSTENLTPPPLAFLAIGDTGCDCPAQRKVADRMLDWYKKHPYSFVLMLGDNIYDMGDTRGGSQKLFKASFDKYYKVLEDRGVEFHAVLGNHDVETRDGKDEIKAVRRFGFLTNKGYYTVTPRNRMNGIPLISFFALNSNTMIDGKQDDEQIAWLRKSLAESGSVWKIAVFHHPIYSPITKHKPEREFGNGVEKVLVDGGIRITLSGHNHIYDRMKSQKGVVHFTSGGGGATLYDVRMNDTTACASKSHHFTYFEVYPEEIRFWAIAADGSLIDAGIIKKEGFSD
jgi:3',5'-cyclic AMP phosphodiesterase CpdA